VGLRAAFFDVGDTLVEGWAPDYGLRARAAVARRFGERHWYDAFFSARHEPEDEEAPGRQDTLGLIRRWWGEQAVTDPDVDPDELRQLLSLPLDTVTRLTDGAAEALRWCTRTGLRVILVTNTLWRGDDEVREDWRRFGLAEHISGVASSHSVGWRKPHRAMFERALELAEARPEEAFMVGDRLYADIWGARQLGIRGILRRTSGGPPQRPVDVTPDAVVGSLAELPAVVGAWR
jgi:FMN phosphatase YigB (HAD superfamily)